MPRRVHESNQFCGGGAWLIVPTGRQSLGRKNRACVVGMTFHSSATVDRCSCERERAEEMHARLGAPTRSRSQLQREFLPVRSKTRLRPGCIDPVQKWYCTFA